jgi:hypothetical protein
MDIKIKCVVATACLAVVMAGCGSSRNSVGHVDVVNVKELPNAVSNSVVYNLPLTALRVEVTATKTIRKVGPFYRYAQKYFSLNNVVTEDSETWSIKSVNVVPYGKVDKFRTFAVIQKGSGVARNISVNSQGILCGINTNVQCDCVPMYNKAEIGNVPSIETVTFDAVPRLEKQLLATSTATMADETAQYIYKLRKRKSRIFTSDYPNLPPDGQAYALIDEEVGQMEKDFLELFAGKVVTVEVTRSFEFIPSRESADNNVLFRFSDKNGFLDRLDLSGAPVYAEVSDLGLRNLPDTPTESSSRKRVPQGLFYNLPGIATVKIVDRNVSIFETDVELAQYGQLMSLPLDVMTQPDLQIVLSPVTGALLKISTR